MKLSALRRMQLDETDRVKTHLVRDKAHAVGTHQGDAAFTRDSRDLALGLGPRGPRLGEPGSNGNRGSDSLAAALFEHRSDLIAAYGQQSEIGRFGQLIDARVGLAAEDLPSFGINGVDGARVSPVEDVLECRAAPLRDIPRRPHERHGPGSQQRPEVGHEIRCRLLRRTVRRKDDECVGRYGPISLHQHRVDIDLGDLGMIESHLAHGLDDLGEGGRVDNRIAPE